MQERQLLATRNLSNRNPSRTKRVTPVMGIGTRLGALVAARAAFKVEHQQVLREKQPLVQILVGLNRLQAIPGLFIAFQDLTRLGKQSILSIQGTAEAGLRKSSPRMRINSTWSSAVQVAVRETRSNRFTDRFGKQALQAAEQTDLAESIARPEVVQHALIATVLLRDLYEAKPADVVVVGVISLTKNRLTWIDGNEIGLVFQVLGRLVSRSLVQGIKDRQRGQLPSQRTLSINTIEDLTADRVALQHVEHVAANLQHFAMASWQPRSPSAG